MRTEKPCGESPFSAMTCQEQQDRWLEWRSRQLDYLDAAGNAAVSDDRRPGEPFLRSPNMPIAAPVRRRELDQVLARHADALRKAGAFRPLTTD